MSWVVLMCHLQSGWGSPATLFAVGAPSVREPRATPTRRRGQTPAFRRDPSRNHSALGSGGGFSPRLPLRPVRQRVEEGLSHAGDVLVECRDRPVVNGDRSQHGESTVPATMVVALRPEIISALRMTMGTTG